MTRTRYLIKAGTEFISNPGSDHQAIEFTTDVIRALKFVTFERASNVARILVDRIELPIIIIAKDLEF